MSRTLTTNQSAQFDAEVKQAYQGSGSLSKTVRVKTGVVGNTHRFPKIGKGLATPRIPQTDVIPMNVAHTGVVATMEDWNAPEYTDIFDQAKVAYSERQALAMTIAEAIHRREDQLIIDALTAGVVSGHAGQVAKTVGAVDGMETTKIRRAAKLLDDQGVPSKDRHFVWSSAAKEQLLGNTAATSGDFNIVKALVNGEINTWMGFQFHMIETRDEGGLPLSTNDRSCYAYHGGSRGAMGLAVGINFRTEVAYINEKTSWLSNGLFSAGAIAIDILGLVDVIVDESIVVNN
uniref:Major capsid protein n=1 Tax=uncultured marine virus TaxID=186617 RepID=A0A0F7L631_9VIRU|nr:hypothetical protein DVVG_00002 [uncultured marine virus]